MSGRQAADQGRGRKRFCSFLRRGFCNRKAGGNRSVEQSDRTKSGSKRYTYDKIKQRQSVEGCRCLPFTFRQEDWGTGAFLQVYSVFRSPEWEYPNPVKTDDMVPSSFSPAPAAGSFFRFLISL